MEFDRMDFESWKIDYAKRFPAFGNLLLESQTLREDFTETFKQFSVEVLRKATREISLLDPQPWPNEHVPKLYNRCKSMTLAPRTHAVQPDPLAEPRYKCLDCRDGGTIEVYHPKAYAPIQSGTFEVKKHLNTLVVACACVSGSRHTEERRYKSGGGERIVSGLKSFDPRRMKQVTATRISEQVDELTKFVKEEMKPAKFSGFEAYQ